jgi:hypothetical protein
VKEKVRQRGRDSKTKREGMRGRENGKKRDRHITHKRYRAFKATNGNSHKTDAEMRIQVVNI